jgi:predicted dehydrogenase
MQNRQRLALVGAGPVVTRYHMPAIRAVPEVVPAMVLDADPVRAQMFAKRHGFSRWTAHVQDLFGQVDLAVIGVPNDYHRSISCELLNQGIHILCEKPMARNISECQDMIDAARRRGAQLAIGHNRRFRQNVQLLKRLLDNHLIGDVIRIDAEEGSQHDWPRSSFYFDPVRAGGGALLDVGIHSIDLIRWLVGEFRELEYAGNGTDSQVEGDAELRFRLSQGAQGTLLASRTRELQQAITFTGTEGFLQLGLWDERLRIRHNRGKAFQHLSHLDAYVSRRPAADPSFVLQLANFVSAIRGEVQVLVDGYQGKAAVEVVNRAYGNLPSLPDPDAVFGQRPGQRIQ